MDEEPHYPFRSATPLLLALWLGVGIYLEPVVPEGLLAFYGIGGLVLISWLFDLTERRR